VYVPTEEHATNLLTKGFGSVQHHHLMYKLGVLNIFTAPSLKGGVEMVRMTAGENCEGECLEGDRSG